MNVEFLYSLDEINRLDEERKGPRSSAETVSDPYSLSNTLRVSG